MSVTTETFGVTRNGTPVTKYILQNSRGMRVEVLNYGCIIQRLLLPQDDGSLRDIVLGYDDMAGYETGSCFFGAFIGRYANRIKGAAFDLGKKHYTLTANDGANHLHGCYETKVYSAIIDGESVIFSRMSPAGEEGYPGNVQLRVTYRLTEENSIILSYYAQTDSETVINLTNHSYFNLNGQGSGTIKNHRLTLDAAFYTEGDAQTIPTGAILPVADTPLDFRTGAVLGEVMEGLPAPLNLYQGFDHNLIINSPAGHLRHFGRAENDDWAMDCYTTQPAVQLYTGNFIPNDTAPCGKGGIRYPQYAGFCLETQNYPCAPNFPHFPSAVIGVDEPYHQITEYRFTKKS